MLHPRYNAATVLAILEEASPQALYLASHGEESLSPGPAWEEDPLLFHLLPWARRRGLELLPLDGEAHLKAEALAFREALGQFPGGQPYLERMAKLEGELLRLLQEPLTPETLASSSFLEALRAIEEGFVQAFGEGPATGFRAHRMAKVAEALRGKEGGVVVDLLDYPVLLEHLPEAQTLAHLPPRTPKEAERARALLDRAWQLKEEDDWAKLLEALAEVKTPEALYLAAQIYLAAGAWPEAKELMEELVQMDLDEPAYLPGYALARLGQLRDLAGERERALGAYRGVLALGYAPKEAREIALAGLRSSFRLKG